MGRYAGRIISVSVWRYPIKLASENPVLMLSLKVALKRNRIA